MFGSCTSGGFRVHIMHGGLFAVRLCGYVCAKKGYRTVGDRAAPGRWKKRSYLLAG